MTRDFFRLRESLSRLHGARISSEYRIYSDDADPECARGFIINNYPLKKETIQKKKETGAYAPEREEKL